MRSLLIPALSLLLIVSACNTNSSSDAEKTETTANPSLTTPNTPQSNLPATTPATTAPTQAAATAVGMNPAHGEPGHRCDIPVGAPLNSAPSTPTVTQQPTITTSQPTVTTAAPVAAPTVTTSAPATGAGLNPAHGQPGHRCDIPVGSPLNSAPKQ